MKAAEIIDIIDVGRGKRCTKCQRDLPLTNFPVARKRNSGFRSWCKECQKPIRARPLTADKSVAIAYVKEHGKTCYSCKRKLSVDAFGKYGYSADGYQGSCRECVNAALKLRRTPERSKHHRLKRTYGIDLEEYNRILISQNEKCLICETPHSKGDPLHVDHDHATGGIRGLLCGKCNIGIGMFKDSTVYLAKAIAYLNSQIRKAA